jgi:hypothetical protein
MRLEGRNALAAVVIIAVLILSASVLPAQEAKGPSSPASPQSPPSSETANAVIPVQYADVNELAEVLTAFIKGPLGGHMAVSPKLRVISVEGSKAFVEVCKEAARKLDVPPVPARSIELTFTVLVASKAGGASEGIPVELQSVVEQLKKLAAFKNLRLADMQAVRVTDGRSVEVQGALDPMEQGAVQVAYSIKIKSASRKASEKEVRISLAQLSMEASVHVRREQSSSAFDRLLSSDIEFSEGQKAVVGTMGVTGTDSLILVVQARDVE